MSEIKQEKSIQICPQCTYVNEHDYNTCSMCRYELFIDLEKEKEKRIEQNYDMAYKLIPGCMMPSSSLYLECRINNFKFKALVDTGADTSIMAYTIIDNCQLADLVDTKHQVQISGVGQTTSVGKIYCVDVMIGDNAVPMSFTVVERPPCDTVVVIIGMDILSNHRAIINIFENKITLSEKDFKLKPTEIPIQN